MSDNHVHGKRLLPVTAGNIRNSHIYVHGHYDFFPADCVGSPRKSTNGNGHQIKLLFDGFDEPVTTDIASSANGKPRGFFRDRRSVRRFFDHHQVVPGDLLAIERVNGRSYRISCR